MAVGIDGVVAGLLAVDEPSVVLAVRRDVLGEPASALEELGEMVRNSTRARALIAGVHPGNVYSKWHGAHWVLADLADLGYPTGRPNSPRFVTGCWTIGWVPILPRIRGPVQGGCLWPAGGADHGGPLPAMRLPAGQRFAIDRPARIGRRAGPTNWSSDCSTGNGPTVAGTATAIPSADTSSFMETLLPMRGLAAYASWRQDETAETGRPGCGRGVPRLAALFRRRRDGSPWTPDFLKLHYPLYWHYDVLGGLVAMAEMDLLEDPRCAEALDLLESKRLADGGWPAEAKFYATAGRGPERNHRRRLGRHQPQANEPLGDGAGPVGAGEGRPSRALTGPGRELRPSPRSPPDPSPATVSRAG